MLPIKNLNKKFKANKKHFNKNLNSNNNNSKQVKHIQQKLLK